MTITPDHRIHYYYNESWQLLEERKEVSSTIDPDPLNQYLWHPYYIDALAIRWYDADTDNSGIVDYYYLHDANFNVTTVVNNSGTAQERYKYTPYGTVIVLNDDFSLDSSGMGDGLTDIGNTHFYTGRELDSETGLQLNRHRFYASALGRWVSRDPIGYYSGASLFEFVACRPTLLVDPTGLTPQQLKDCNSNCLKNHSGWFVNASLLNCYEMCQRMYDKCGDLERSLRDALHKMCDKKSPDYRKCLFEGAKIASAIGETCRHGARPFRPRNPSGQTVRGNWCFEWAYGYEDAVNQLNPQFFKCKMDYAIYEKPISHGLESELYPQHSWLEIGISDQSVFIDDGFMEAFPGYFHTQRPHGGAYIWPRSLAADPYPGVKRSECVPVTPRPPWDGRLKTQHVTSIPGFWNKYSK